eukprot:c24605_g1_i7 orf=312-812(+)
MKVMPESTMAVAKTYLGGQVFSDYSVTVIPGDGRCLFRALAHGAHLRSGKSAPNVSLEQELADNLRQKVLDELVKQREVSEWFIEGKFEDYVKWMRLPDAWGGEPELFIASHVLKMPIIVYMHKGNLEGIIPIAEYGQEYGKNSPITILYHEFGHYDIVQIAHRGG